MGRSIQAGLGAIATVIAGQGHGSPIYRCLDAVAPVVFSTPLHLVQTNGVAMVVMAGPGLDSSRQREQDHRDRSHHYHDVNQGSW